MLESLAVPSGRRVLDVLPRVAAALAGTTTLAPYAEDAGAPDLDPTATGTPAGLALVVGTSGSTGEPKRAMLTAANLRASGEATHAILGGAGSWLLAMPAHHIAGFQVLVRSVLAGTEPTVLDQSEGFTPERFVEAASRHEGAPGLARYTSLVPTQVSRILTDAAATAALQAYDAVLVGGAATPPALRRRAVAAGVTLVPTYGMSETAGGCVYAGRPLAGTRVELHDGRIHLGGPTVALGYLGRPDLSTTAFRTDADGTRWFRTDDAGHLDDFGVLHVDGRLDDLINTGGFKVAPRVVEEAVLDHVPAAADVCVVGVPDDEWGQAVALAVVGVPGATPAATSLDALREALREHLPAYALPTRARTVPEIPSRGPGKPDRRAVRQLLTVGQ